MQECRRRGLKVAVAGIPKTIDNDIPVLITNLMHLIQNWRCSWTWSHLIYAYSFIQVIDKSFGFDTAVEEAQRAINAAHVEAESIENGIGVVKLMGRYSGKVLFL